MHATVRSGTATSYRSEGIGSLLRPQQYVTDARQQFERGEVTAAARVVPLERLAVSPQCGFASTSEGNRLSPDDQRRKLGVVAETARAVWPRG